MCGKKIACGAKTLEVFTMYMLAPSPEICTEAEEIVQSHTSHTGKEIPHRNDDCKMLQSMCTQKKQCVSHRSDS